MKKTIFSGFLIFCLFGVLFFVAFINIMPANAEENNLKIEVNQKDFVLNRKSIAQVRTTYKE